jgi:hypothetical protein
VASLHEEMSILFTGSSHQHPIGGFPGTVQQFLGNKQADALLGLSDHQSMVAKTDLLLLKRRQALWISRRIAAAEKTTAVA